MFFFPGLRDYSKYTNYNWYHCHIHVPQQVQTLYGAVGISQSVNIIGNGMNPILLPSTMRVDIGGGQIEYLNLGMATLNSNLISLQTDLVQHAVRAEGFIK